MSYSHCLIHSLSDSSCRFHHIISLINGSMKCIDISDGTKIHHKMEENFEAFLLISGFLWDLGKFQCQLQVGGP